MIRLLKIHQILTLFLLALFLVPALASAHQPRITESRLTQVPDPEISKAYYGELTGEPDVYIIEANEPFDLYVNVLVPDIPGQKKDVSAVVLKNPPAGEAGGNTETPLAVLEGSNFEWKQFYEPFGADTYWMGPEYKERAEAGVYEIRVWSSNNDSKYSLAIGEREAFGLREIINTLKILPVLKSSFFNESPFAIVVSPFVWGPLLALLILIGAVWFTAHLVFKRRNV